MIKSLVVAVSENGIIGNNNRLLWKLRDDMKHFREITMGHFIIMGRKTFESMGKPLSGRTNIVVSRNPGFNTPGIILSNSLQDAFHYAESEEQDEIYIIGGAEIYRQALPSADKIYYTRVLADFTGDVRFPELNWNSWIVKLIAEYKKDERNEYPFQIFELAKPNN